MRYGQRCFIAKAKKEEYIDKLTPQLASLRARAGLSQDELSGLIGVSRQTYCLTESGVRKMSWSTYLTVVLFFDKNSRTHDLIRSMGVYTEEIFGFLNPEDGDGREEFFAAAEETKVKMFESLDDEGVKTVNATLITEYARCNKLTRAETLKLLEEHL